jgi:hypothetical protein
MLFFLHILHFMFAPAGLYNSDEIITGFPISVIESRIIFIDNREIF